MKLVNCCVTWILFLGLHAGAVAEPVPLELFAAQEEMLGAAISPDGRYLATINTIETNRVVVVRDLRAADKPVSVMNVDQNAVFDLEWCRWATDTRLICGLRGATEFRQYRMPSWKLIAVNADGSQLMAIDSLLYQFPADFNDQVFEPMVDEPGKILLRSRIVVGTLPNLTMSARRSVPNDLLEVDTFAGKRAQVEEMRRGFGNLYSDGQGRIVLGEGSHDRARYWSALIQKKWIRLEKASEFFKENPVFELQVNASTGRAYGYAAHEGRRALWDIDIQDKQAPVLGFSHPTVDVERYLTDANGALIGVNYYTDKPNVQYFDAGLVSTLSSVNKALPNTFNQVRSMTRDRKLLVISARSDLIEERFYLFDVTARRLSALGAKKPGLEKNLSTHTRSVQYDSRDGKKVTAYLTSSKNDSAEKMPLVVLLHDGFRTRARFEFDLVTQFLASRGYAVLRPNYRGSWGLGEEWAKPSDKPVVEAAYNDVVDAARWAIEQGVADPRRVCVVGSGLSGYLAARGAIQDADLYQCGVSVGGMLDPDSYISVYRNLAPTLVEAAMLLKDAEQLSVLLERSTRVSPLLLLHGAQDVSIPLSQSEKGAAALKRAKTQHAFIKVDSADGTFRRASERSVLLGELERFLSESLQRSN